MAVINRGLLREEGGKGDSSCAWIFEKIHLSYKK